MKDDKSPIKIETVASMNKLNEEQQKSLEDGTAVAIPVRSTSFSDRRFTIALAIAVGATVLPFWTGVSGLLFGGIAVSNILWIVMCKIQADLFTRELMKQDIMGAVHKQVIRYLAEPTVSKGEKEKGTFEE
jgi:hypothetical protein